VQPDEVLFVVDAMIGQDAVTTARPSATASASPAWCSPSSTATPEAAPRCPCARVTGQPIMFASNGEKQDDFDVFHPDRMASRILGMGDLLTLIEQAEQHFDQEKAQATAAKLGTGELTLEDFLEQMLAVRKMARSPTCWACCPAPAR